MGHRAMVANDRLALVDMVLTEVEDDDLACMAVRAMRPVSNGPAHPLKKSGPGVVCDRLQVANFLHGLKKSGQKMLWPRDSQAMPSRTNLSMLLING